MNDAEIETFRLRTAKGDTLYWKDPAGGFLLVRGFRANFKEDERDDGEPVAVLEANKVAALYNCELTDFVSFSPAFTTPTSDMRDAEGQLRHAPACGETIAQMREAVRQTELYQTGDLRLVWVNEGDLLMLSMRQAGRSPTPVPDAEGHKRGLEAALRAWYGSEPDGDNDKEVADMAKAISAYLESTGAVLCDAQPVDLSRPIAGIENRTPQEVFDIMVDRFRLATRSPSTPEGE